MIWAAIRNKQLGHKFRRQQPIGPFIVDFVCFAKRVIVELDGWTHDLEQNQHYDVRRHARLEELGYRVLRFNDEDVLEDRVGVVDAICAVLESS